MTLNHLKSVYGSRGDSVKNLIMAGGETIARTSYCIDPEGAGVGLFKKGEF
jgi:hypothetical protein